MKNLKYVIYQEGDYYVSKCLNAEVSSFGKTIDEALENLKKATALYLEDNNLPNNFYEIGELMFGELAINA